MNRHIVYGVHITDRVKNALQVQQLLTKYGCNIQTRIGLHETGPKHCSPEGLIVLEMLDDEDTPALKRDLSAIEGIEVKEMIFDHPE
ncbi:MAG: hypothetical protein AMXMBFR84_20440 [Candidatus Hydrogenedentota bacterium]